MALQLHLRFKKHDTRIFTFDANTSTWSADSGTLSKKEVEALDMFMEMAKTKNLRYPNYYESNAHMLLSYLRTVPAIDQEHLMLSDEFSIGQDPTVLY